LILDSVSSIFHGLSFFGDSLRLNSAEVFHFYRNGKVKSIKTQDRRRSGAVGRRIRELRGFDTTKEEFARRVGVTQGHLSRLERGEKEPGAGVLLTISREFGKSVDWLLTGKTHIESKNPAPKDPAELK